MASLLKLVPEPKIKGKKLNVPLSFTPQAGETVAEKWRFVFLGFPSVVGSSSQLVVKSLNLHFCLFKNIFFGNKQGRLYSSLLLAAGQNPLRFLFLGGA